MKLHLDALHKSLKNQRLATLEVHKAKMKDKKMLRETNAQVSYTLEPDVAFVDIKELKASRGRMGDHSGWTGTELRAIRREKGVGRPVV